MADHLVKIQLVDNIHAQCFPGQIIAQVGDTVTYQSGDTPNLPFRVVFDTPFFAVEIKDSKPLLLSNPGHFFGKCFLTRPDGVEVGWFYGEVPQSGNDQDVRPGGP